MHHDQLRLHADDGAARDKVAAAVEALLLHEGAPRLTVILDGDRLPAATIAALVAGLRRLRERGGAIEIKPASTGVRNALALAGLDRVFAFPLATPDKAKRPSAVTGRLGRGAVAALAAVVLLSTPAVAEAPAASDPAALLARVIERNPSLTSYQGRMHVDLRMTSFPFIRQHLDATTYYKRPANYEVVFDSVPSYAKGFEKLFADVGDPAGWQKRFAISYAGEKEFRGRKDVQLRMVQKVRGMIDHETVLVDPADATIDQIRYDYYNGGAITMTQTFSNVGGYTMLLSQDAEIAIPHVRAVAHGDYIDYKTNVAISDSVFVKKN